MELLELIQARRAQGLPPLSRDELAREARQMRDKTRRPLAGIDASVPRGDRDEEEEGE